jgi:ABC-type phosphate/phosphonate transport system substrate-binding protein
MYDLPALRDANDALWRGLAGWLRAHGVDDVPERLDRERPLAQIWDDPDLLLGQTCGLPFATRWHGRLRYVATPMYGAPGCEGPSYRSVLIVARDSSARQLGDLRGTTVAINEPTSNSGCNLLLAAIVPSSDHTPFFANAAFTGSHLASAQAVADGRAATAAIDVVTYAHLGRHHPTLTQRLRAIGWTPSAPGLPIVTSIAASSELVRGLRRALAWAMQAVELREVRETLLLTGFAQVPDDQYRALAMVTGAKTAWAPPAPAKSVSATLPINAK